MPDAPTSPPDPFDRPGRSPESQIIRWGKPDEGPPAEIRFLQGPQPRLREFWSAFRVFRR